MSKIIAHIKTFIKETDKILLFFCMLLSAVGVLEVSSASRSGDALLSRDARVMLIAVAAGVILSLIISMIDYNFIVRLWPIIAGVCILLMLLLFTPLGVGPPSRPDVKTWLSLGNTGLYFQPSELVKVGFIITFAVHLDSVSDSVNSLKQLLLLCVHAAVPIILVTLSGDMGSALIFILIFIAMLFTAGVHLRWFALGGAIVAAALPVAWKFILTGIQKDRIYALFDHDAYPDIIYQQEQGLRAMKNGGFFGMGLFKGSYTQSGMIPESENDMIFSVIGEEFGLFGCLVVLLLFVLVIIRIIKTSKNTKDKTVSLICSGVASMIMAQVLVNVGMCLELLPVVGITLPFLSAGGSSNLCIYIAVGLVLSLRRYTLEKDIVNFRYKNISTPFA